MLSTRYFNFKVIDSYVSDRNRISRDNAYVIVKFSTKGKISKYNFKLDNFVLKVKIMIIFLVLNIIITLMILVQDIKGKNLLRINIMNIFLYIILIVKIRIVNLL